MLYHKRPDFKEVLNHCAAWNGMLSNSNCDTVGQNPLTVARFILILINTPEGSFGGENVSERASE